MAHQQVSPIEEIIQEAIEGRPYILVDADDRENEGDVIIPAQFATPAQINFMARHARGLICLAISRARLVVNGVEAAFGVEQQSQSHQKLTSAVQRRLARSSGLMTRYSTVSITLVNSSIQANTCTMFRT